MTCKHTWEKVGSMVQRGGFLFGNKTTAIVYVCTSCLEKKQISV